MNNLVIRAGLIFGAAVIVVRALQQVVDLAMIQSIGTLPDQTADPQAFLAKVGPIIGILAGVSFFVLLVDCALYLLAGRSAASKTGNVGSGALAGLVAGLFAGIVGGVIGYALSAAGITTSLNTSTTSTLNQGTLAALVVVGVIIGLAIEAGIGAGMGALGGLMGKSAYEKANVGMPMGMPGGYSVPPQYPEGPMQ
jgi:hypothetical protein